MVMFQFALQLAFTHPVIARLICQPGDINYLPVKHMLELEDGVVKALRTVFILLREIDRKLANPGIGEELPHAQGAILPRRLVLVVFQRAAVIAFHRGPAIRTVLRSDRHATLSRVFPHVVGEL